ncbi:hypothetical protein SK3146_02524 [Paenibacillus konkukensis]|uniref:AAA family ATPase n=1 Tax=Paenibacillus konkukensis TaxID=2020716 RepID=A0ABY4RLF0_9BACL|nr:AAA family ATPase [Paenibacillus konkukensis]UQZ83337.1 hypothetical protein SK3146_02524 [Paenibacillus konkukensis]
MIISEVSQGKKAPYSVMGTVLTVGTVTIDLQERQQSIQNVINICLDNQLQTMGVGLGAWYVATVIIPPRQRQLIPTGELDEEENEVMTEIELPLDMNRVELRLWGLPEEYDPENAEEEDADEQTENETDDEVSK